MTAISVIKIRHTKLETISQLHQPVGSQAILSKGNAYDEKRQKDQNRNFQSKKVLVIHHANIFEGWILTVKIKV